MTDKQQLTSNLIQPKIQSPSVRSYASQGMEIKRSNILPSIKFTGLSMVLLCPILFVIHLFIAHLSHVPVIQYSFVTLFGAFILNYAFIIRKYQVTPFLPDQGYDNQLKIACVLTFAGMLCSLTWGWNGSGGIIFAILWEKFRGNKMGDFKLFYGIIIVGSLLLEKHYTWMKLVEFIPGILFGIAASIIFTLKESQTYVMAHQYVFLASLCLPMFFPTTHLVVPTLWQWIIMTVASFLMLFTVLLTVKLMQSQRVSIVMAVTSGIIMVGTSSYVGSVDFVAGIIILIAVVLIVKKEFLELEY